MSLEAKLPIAPLANQTASSASNLRQANSAKYDSWTEYDQGDAVGRALSNTLKMKNCDCKLRKKSHNFGS
jgi:hypothetical protein